MDALAQQLELLVAALAGDDELAVEHVAAGDEPDLGEVARHRLAVARLQVGLAAVDEGDRAEAVPLGLVGPAGVLREARARTGELGEDRGRQGERHRLWVEN